jgi:hypothetical protein
MSTVIIPRGICGIALAECGLARVMPQRSGTSWIFCAVRA